jgi:hypothetical protein
MAAVFSPRANLFMRAALIVLIILPLAAGGGLFAWYMSPYCTHVGRAVPQPIPFSHAYHVGGLGLDRRYRHQTAEVSAFAGIPAMDTCTHCHWQLWTEAPLLEPLRASWRTGERLHWQRVHDLPDYVFFDRSVHVNNGVDCTTCHGAARCLADRSPAVIGPQGIASWAEFLREAQARLVQHAPHGGKGFCLLTGHVTSPTLPAAIARLLHAYPEMRWHVHEAIDDEHTRRATTTVLGQPAELVYDFSAATRILAVANDFLFS